MADYDAVIVGSGVNSLACGALLARAGWRICVLERNDWFGGAIKTEELTEPGFLHVDEFYRRVVGIGGLDLLRGLVQ